MVKVDVNNGFTQVASPAFLRFRHHHGRRKKVGRFSGGNPANAVTPYCQFAARIEALAGHEDVGSAAFQSVVVVVLRVLERVRQMETNVLKATASLGQRERLKEMTSSLDANIAALCGILNASGRMMRNLHAETEVEQTPESLWWFALADALHTLEDGINRVAATVACQAKWGPNRTLGGIVTQMLHAHYNIFFHEAEEWMG